MRVAESKIAAPLLAAIRASDNDSPDDVRADVMVQLESPEQAMDRACGSVSADATRAQRTTCMVDSMQQFADAAQAQVKELLARATDRHASATFFWINNSVSVKQALGSLILELAQLDSVVSVRAEQIFQLQGKDKSKSTTHETTGTAATTTTAKQRIGGAMTFGFDDE